MQAFIFIQYGQENITLEEYLLRLHEFQGDRKDFTVGVRDSVGSHAKTVSLSEPFSFDNNISGKTSS